MDSIKENHEYNLSEVNDNGESCKEHKDKPGLICTCGRMPSPGMMMTVAIDSEIPKTANGGQGGMKTNKTFENVSSGGKKINSMWLESSFVHLMTPSNISRTTNGNDDNLNLQSTAMSSTNAYQHIDQDQYHSQHGYLERHQHLLNLLEAAYLHVDEIEHDGAQNDTDGHPSRVVELCVNCVDRVALALEADTQRLYAEIEAYRETVQASKQRSKAIQKSTKHIASAGIVSDSIQQHPKNIGPTKSDNFLDNRTIEQVYQEEIEILEMEIQSRYDELLNYKSIHKEQTDITRDLNKMEEGLHLEENSLQLQSEAFDNRRQVLTKALSEVQNEVDKLTCVSLPKVLFNLQVDQARGLHYPLINQLRLAFRPKGDVPAQEIQVAWSQATQLLLILGTLLEYPGKDWKLVPLADCAKLIYRKEIFNLVPGDCRSLMAWNALLDQVVKHVLSLLADSRGSAENIVNSASVSQNGHHQRENRLNIESKNSTSTRCNDPFTLLKPIPPPYLSSPTTIGNTELSRLDPTDHVGWSQVIHRMASNLLWLSNRASNLSAIQVSSLAHCAV